MRTQLKMIQKKIKKNSKITVDSFIDELIEFEQTVISKANDFLSVQQVLQREFYISKFTAN